MPLANACQPTKWLNYCRLRIASVSRYDLNFAANFSFFSVWFCSVRINCIKNEFTQATTFSRQSWKCLKLTQCSVNAYFSFLFGTPNANLPTVFLCFRLSSTHSVKSIWLPCYDNSTEWARLLVRTSHRGLWNCRLVDIGVPIARIWLTFSRASSGLFSVETQVDKPTQKLYRLCPYDRWERMAAFTGSLDLRNYA